MKIRHGFVSNSSSSSFLAVGVSFDLAKQMLDADGMFKDIKNRSDMYEEMEKYCYDEGGVYKSDSGVLYAGVEYLDENVTAWYAGIEIEELLETNTLPEIREMFKKKASELGLDIPIEKINLICETVSDG